MAAGLASSEHGLITPEQLPTFVPGQILSGSDGLGWNGVMQRSWRYRGQDVEIPPMNTFMVVQYFRGETPMDRRYDARWTRTRCAPGNFSLLSRAAESHWNWTAGVEVSHVYLSNELMTRVASDVEGRKVASVHLHDVLRGEDPLVSRIVGEISREAAASGPGSALYVEALSVQLAVQLLRRYASCAFRTPGTGCLSRAELARLGEYVDARLHDSITLDDMATQLGLGVWTFGRRFRQTMGVSAYAFVLERRIERARRYLREGKLALKEVAHLCGFSDQAHMTRAFRARLGVTPARYRRGT